MFCPSPPVFDKHLRLLSAHNDHVSVDYRSELIICSEFKKLYQADHHCSIITFLNGYILTVSLLHP